MAQIHRRLQAAAGYNETTEHTRQEVKQRTLISDFTVYGKGLHTGLVITARFCPAAENTGIRICRTDLADCPAYEALADYVTQTRRGTVLEH